jgi:RND family efflux transporter MFP subunit
MTTTRRNGLTAAGIFIGAIVLAVFLVLIRPSPPRTPPPDRTPQVSASPAAAVDGPLQVRGSGTVRPWAQIELAPQVGGRVEWVSPSFVSGARVDSGQVLLRIERADYENAVRQARAQVAQDEVALLQAAEEARIAQREYEQFVARRPDSLAPLDAPSALTLREPQLAAAEAALERSRAQLADAELALSRTVLSAPFDAVVRSENADPGGFAVAGQPLATLFAAEIVEVVVPLSDEEAALIPGLWSPDASARAEIDVRVVARIGGEEWFWTGQVDRAEAALDELSRTLDVIVRVDDPFQPGLRVPSSLAAAGAAGPTAPSAEASVPSSEASAPSSEASAPSAEASAAEGPPLLVGQFVDAEISGREGKYLRIPRRALRTGNEVWLIEGDSVVRIRPVEVLQRGDNDVIVRGDLEPGVAIITDGVSLATDGMRVRVLPGAGS